MYVHIPFFVFRSEHFLQVFSWGEINSTNAMLVGCKVCCLTYFLLIAQNYALARAFLILDILYLLLFQAIFTAGYKAILHIHSVVEECEIIELLQQMDPKTRKPMKKRVLFVKNNAIVKCRVQVHNFILDLLKLNSGVVSMHKTQIGFTIICVQVNNMICIEKFEDFPQLGRFTLRTEGNNSIHQSINFRNDQCLI